MTNRFLAVPVVALLAACQMGGGATSASWSPIVGQPMSLVSLGDGRAAEGNLTINANGTVTGDFEGAATNLVWTEEGGLFCREGTIGTNAVPNKCQNIVIDGNQVSFFNRDGSLSSVYRLG